MNKTIQQVSEVYDILSSRRKKFAEHLRSKGIEPGEASFLRNAAYQIDSVHLALDADGVPAPEVNESKKTATFTITTSAKDRYGDVVIPKGCIPHLKNYRSNPRVFFAHKSTDLPIGSCRRADTKELDLVFFENSIKGTCHFHCETPESEVVFRLTARGELQASSIGFLPVRAALFEPEKTPNRPETDAQGDDIVYFAEDPWFKPLRFLEWDMLEWSIVPIPANSECLAEHLSRGTVEGEKITPLLRKALEPYAAVRKVQLGYTMPWLDGEQKKEEQDPEPVELQYEVPEFSWDKEKDVLLKNGEEFLTGDLLRKLKDNFQTVWDGAGSETTASKDSEDVGKEEIVSSYHEHMNLIGSGWILWNKDGVLEVSSPEDFVKEFAPVADDPYKGWPFGAKFLALSVGQYDAVCSLIKECEPMLDQPRVKRLASKKMKRMEKLKGLSLKLGAELYPDKFSYEEPPQDESSGKKSVKEVLEEKLTEEQEKNKKLEETVLALVKDTEKMNSILFKLTGRKVN